MHALCRGHGSCPGAQHGVYALCVDATQLLHHRHTGLEPWGQAAGDQPSKHCPIMASPLPLCTASSSLCNWHAWLAVHVAMLCIWGLHHALQLHHAVLPRAAHDACCRPCPDAFLYPLQSDFSRGYGTVLDSGTTFTYLPSSAYKAFLTALTAAIQHHPELKRASGKDPSVSVYTVRCWVSTIQYCWPCCPFAHCTTLFSFLSCCVVLG